MSNCCVANYYDMVEENISLKQHIEGLEQAFEKLEKENKLLRTDLVATKRKLLKRESEAKYWYYRAKDQETRDLSLVEEISKEKMLVYQLQQQLEKSQKQINYLNENRCIPF